MIPAGAPHHPSATARKDRCAASWLGLLALCLLVHPAGAVDYMLEEQLQARLQRAEQGDVTAQYAVGDMYFKGRGTVVDLEQARIWLERAAANGHRKAEFRLGYMYLKGLGVGQDEGRAFRLFKASAEKRYSPAQFYLGQMYALGLGVEQSRNRALKWLTASLEEGYRPPKAELARIRADLDRAMNGTEPSEEERRVSGPVQ